MAAPAPRKLEDQRGEGPGRGRVQRCRLGQLDVPGWRVHERAGHDLRRVDEHVQLVGERDARPRGDVHLDLDGFVTAPGRERVPWRRDELIEQTCR